MLLGEHAVVYDRPCIVTSIDQRMFVTIEKTNDDSLLLNAPDVNVKNYKKPMAEIGTGDIPNGAKFIEIAVKNFKENYPFKGGLKIITKSQFSAQFGFGSSSASTVCVTQALSKLFTAKLENNQLFDLSYKTILEIQGKGSGFDVAAAIFGGTLYFVTAGKVIKPLKIKNLPLVIGYSGIKADTADLINKVREKANKYPQIFKIIYDQIAELVNLAKIAILKQDWKTLGELIDLNQGFLDTLGVSIRNLEEMIYEARSNGAYGAKLSGAGGGDCMISLVPDSKKTAVIKAINKFGKVIKVQANVEGVRVER